MKFFKNPFEVSTPEEMSTEDTISLFVDVFSDFPKLLSPGHTFLNGPRGSGKSMMYRFLMPDCQSIHLNKDFNDLNFFSFYIPLKNFNFITELKRLDQNHGEDAINSSLLTLHCAIKIFQQLSDIERSTNSFDFSELCDLYKNYFVPKVKNITWNNSDIDVNREFENSYSILSAMTVNCEALYSEVTQYLKRYTLNPSTFDYDGPICDYLDFLFPLLKAIRSLSSMPKGPIFLLIDDADNLSSIMTKILNGWVSTRTSNEVSLKISTQLGYKTYYTVLGNIIETPHDYYEINISTIYTNTIKYKKRLKSIIERRFKASNITSTPDEFFPENIEQKNQIALIADEIKRNYAEDGRGYSVHDDIKRYARPEYIKRLAGTAKSSHTYSYAGFEQLTHISSGIIRYFLDFANNMYNEFISDKMDDETVTSIPVSIQNKVIRKDADEFLYDNLEKEIKDVSDHSMSKENGEKLSRLLRALGGLFRECLISERSERRVFSIALTDEISDEVKDVLDLGVKLGYLHKALIGKKQKNEGRTRLYILSRRLAPIWTLDPSGFAGYLFVKNELLQEALYKPKSMLKRISKHGLDEELDSAQLTFDFDER